MSPARCAGCDSRLVASAWETARSGTATGTRQAPARAERRICADIAHAPTGASCKPLPPGERRVTVTLRLTPAAAARLRTLADASGLSRADVVSALVAERYTAECDGV
jgi:hypothetical protein